MTRWLIRVLAGLLIVREPGERDMGLPAPEHELALVLQDRRFRQDNQLVFKRMMMDDMNGVLGDRVLVNGVDDAAFKVAPKSHDAAVESVARALERQAQREVQSLKRGLGILATVGSTAPFVGLLGTVMGIVNSFQSMAATGSGGLGTVSAGIAGALVTTAFGLLVAIPAVMAFNFLQGWVDDRAVDISGSSNEFLDAVAKHYSSQG